MTAILTEPGARPWALVRAILINVRDGLARACARPGDHWTIDHMRAMPDYLLRDMGVHRSEIEGVVRGLRPRPNDGSR